MLTNFGNNFELSSLLLSHTFDSGCDSVRVTFTVDGVYEADSVFKVLRQACGLPGSHDAAG